MSRTTKAQNAKNNRAYRQRQREKKADDDFRLRYAEKQMNEAYAVILEKDAEIDALRRAQVLLKEMVSKATNQPLATIEELLEYRRRSHRLLDQVEVDTSGFLTMEEIYPQTKRLPNG